MKGRWELEFVTVVNCMDGRVQLPVINYLQQTYDARYVDSVTEAGPVRFLADGGESNEKDSILRRVAVSVNGHGSRLIAVVGHADCTGNTADIETQKAQLAASASLLAASFPEADVVGLWLDEDWVPRELLREGGGAA